MNTELLNAIQNMLINFANENAMWQQPQVARIKRRAGLQPVRG